MTLPEPAEYLQFLAPYPMETQVLAQDLRRKVVELLPDCIETLWDATNTVGSSFGFTERNADHFIHLPVYTKYVNIGFSNGALLEDSESRLKGTGTRIRHIRLDRAEDLDDPYLHGLIRQAWETAALSTDTVTPRTLIRIMDGPKRRPKPSA